MEPEDIGDDSQPAEAEEELLVPAVITDEFFENLCGKTNSVSFKYLDQMLYFRIILLSVMWSLVDKIC